MSDFMSVKFIPTLPLDAKYYQRCYQAFSHSIVFDKPYELWYNQVLGTAILGKLVRQTDGQVSGTFTKAGLLRHMGVGSGSGELERQILLALLGKFKSIYNCVIEPSNHQITMYQELVRKDHDLSTDVEYNWHQQTLEELASENKNGRPDDRFDVITAVHTIYYGHRMEEKVPYLFNLLADGGVLAFVLLSETDSLSQVQRHFLSPDIAGYRYYSKEKLQSFLSTNNIDFDTIDIPRFTINVTSCFDNSSQEGALLLDFISHMKHFRTEVALEKQEKFMNLLQENVHIVGGQSMLTHDTAAIIIQRNSNQKFKE